MKVTRHSDHSADVEVGPNTHMSLPLSDLEWMYRYGNLEHVDNRNLRFVVASVIESFRYLIIYCNKEEAWRRIKLMRKALEVLNSSES